MARTTTDYLVSYDRVAVTCSVKRLDFGVVCGETLEVGCSSIMEGVVS